MIDTMLICIFNYNSCTKLFRSMFDYRKTSVINLIYSFRLVSFREMQWIVSMCEWKWVNHTFSHHLLRNAELIAGNVISYNEIHAQNPFIHFFFQNEWISGFGKHFSIIFDLNPELIKLKLRRPFDWKKMFEFYSASTAMTHEIVQCSERHSLDIFGCISFFRLKCNKYIQEGSLERTTVPQHIVTNEKHRNAQAKHA